MNDPHYLQKQIIELVENYSKPDAVEIDDLKRAKEFLENLISLEQAVKNQKPFHEELYPSE